MSTAVTRLYNWVTDKLGGVKITASKQDAELNQLITALNRKVLCSSSAPSSPIAGQTWFDTTNKVLKVYRNNEWVIMGMLHVGTTAPSTVQEGDLWYDTTNNILKSYDGASWQTYIVNTFAWPKGYLYGLKLSNNSGDVTNDLDISAGVARDDTNAYNISLASAMTKRGDAAFSAGTGNGGGDITGSAGKRYVYLIGKSTDSTAADIFLSASAPGSVSLPATWDIKRLICILYWGGSAWTKFFQVFNGMDRRIELYDGITVLNAGTAGAYTDVDVSAYVDPAYCRVIHAVISSVSAGNSPGTGVRPNGSSEAINPVNYMNEADAFPGASNIRTRGDIVLDASGIFEYYNVGTSSTIYLRGYTISL